jgi:HD domain
VNPPSLAADHAGSNLLAGLLRVLARARPDADMGLITRAYEVSASSHRDQWRLSGDPYITHPVAVAAILAGIGSDDATLCAGLLHDVVYDSPCTLATLRSEFGTEIADLVGATMALDGLTGRDLTATDVVAAAQDTKALMIKVADRLHNMRTLRHLPPAKQVKKSTEALKVLAPVAGTLHLDAIKTELENLASTTLQRHGQRPGTASGHVLAATTALLPASARARWRDEWLGELHTLTSRRERAAFAVQTLLGVGRLTVTLYQPEAVLKRAFRAIFAAGVTASGLFLGGWRAVAAVTATVIAVLAAITWVLRSDDRTRRFAQLITAFRNGPGEVSRSSSGGRGAAKR